MSTHFLQYWEPAQADHDMSVEIFLTHSGSNQFRRVKVHPGDTVWIVTVRSPGVLSAIGKILVGEVIGYEEAVKRVGDNVWESEHHIIAKPGTEEELREVNLMDIAAHLRFKSSSQRDRLKIEDGLVKAQQLQAMRRLAADSVALLESKWYSSDLPDVQEIERQIKSGAGFGNPKTNREVERAAVAFVTKWYKARGWNVQSVEAKKCGYDLLCKNGTIEEHVEVKGIQGTGLSFIITSGEVRQAHNNPVFRLCAVTSALSNKPKMFYFSGKEFSERFELAELAFRANLKLLFTTSVTEFERNG